MGSIHATPSAAQIGTKPLSLSQPWIRERTIRRLPCTSQFLTVRSPKTLQWSTRPIKALRVCWLLPVQNMVRSGWSLVFNGFVLLYWSVSSGYSGKDLWKLKQERPELFGVAPAAARLHVYVCVCVNHLNRCKTSLCFLFGFHYYMQGVAADHLGPLPTKTLIWSGDTDWDANLRTRNFLFQFSSIASG